MYKNKVLLVLLGMIQHLSGYSQKNYSDSLLEFRNEYIQAHTVVNDTDKKRMQFFPIDEKYRVKASFIPVLTGVWFAMPTSGTRTPNYKVYGVISFTIDGKQCQLNVYQSQSLLESATNKEHLFLPFMDENTGKSTYEIGRYINLKTTDIAPDGSVIVDFNKTYNPYCAYVSGKYNCPITPADNRLKVAVNAGERNFNKN